MKRFHVHMAVPDLQHGIRFYSTIFGAEPSVVKEDYAKWMLEDPRMNFAISQRGGVVGINHVGFQVDDPSELEEIGSRLRAARAGVTEEKNIACCYARSDKYWVTDPAGVAWESFHNLGTVPFYHGDNGDNGDNGEAGKSACCAPADADARTGVACCG